MQMSGPRLLAITLGIGLLVTGVFVVWLHSPIALSLLAAAAFGAIFMIVAASIGDDPMAADAAWRAEAADLIGGRDEPEPEIASIDDAARDK
jgi:hypothetical protein